MSLPSASSLRAELYTHRLADWLLLPQPRPQTATLCGRITLISDVGTKDARVLFDDGETACFLQGPALSMVTLRVGDFVRIVPQPEPIDTAGPPPTLDVRAVEVLSRPAGGDQFLSPRDDWYRLQKAGRRRAQMLSARAALLAAVRQFFSERGFLEIEAPLQVPSPGLELHLAAFSTQPGGRYLITSPACQR